MCVCVHVSASVWRARGQAVSGQRQERPVLALCSRQDKQTKTNSDQIALTVAPAASTVTIQTEKYLIKLKESLWTNQYKSCVHYFGKHPGL